MDKYTEIKFQSNQFKSNCLYFSNLKMANINATTEVITYNLKGLEIKHRIKLDTSMEPGTDGPSVVFNHQESGFTIKFDYRRGRKNGLHITITIDWHSEEDFGYAAEMRVEHWEPIRKKSEVVCAPTSLEFHTKFPESEISILL